MSVAAEIPPSADVQPIKGAVEHLKELAAKLRLPDDAEDVNLIVEALEEMESACKTLHERLETVTIQSSVLRHRLRSFPVEFDAELSDALAAAHKLNAAQIKKLNDELNEIDDGMQRAARKKEVVELHDAVLVPDRKQLTGKHDELVRKLNSVMSDKASRQITLNETRQKLAAANKKLGLAEAEIVHLGKVMEKEEENKKTEEECLKQKIADTVSSAEKVTDENVEIRRKIAKLQDDLVMSSSVLDSKGRSLKLAESSRDELFQLEASLKEEETSARVSLTVVMNQTADILNEHEAMRAEFARRKCELIGMEKQMKEQLRIAVEENGKMLAFRKGVRSDLRSTKEKAERSAILLASVRETVNSARKDLVCHAEECGRLRQDIGDLKFRKVQLEETHRADVALLNDSILGTRARLDKERSERQRVQAEQSEVASAKVAVQQEQSRALSATTNRITSAVQRQEELKNQSEDLKASLTEYNALESTLKQQLADTSTKFTTMKDHLEEVVKNLEVSIEHLESRLTAAGSKLVKTKPQMESLEVACQENRTFYEDKKKEIVALKNKKAGIADTISRACREIERLHIPQEKLRGDIGKQRVDVLLAMKSHTVESEALEKEIRRLEDRLRSIQWENARFQNGIGELRRDRAELESKYKGSAPAMKELEADLTHCRDLLDAGFHQGQELEKEQNERDRIVLGNMGSVGKSANERQQRISEVREKIAHELDILGDFLEAAANKKQKKKKH